MHILFILDYFHPYIWWIETLFDDLTDFCVKKWYTVTILTSHHDKQIPKIEKRKWVTIYRVGKNRISIAWQALIRSIQHKTILQSVDHIHTSTFTSSIPAWIVSKLYKKPCTITVHEIYDTLRYHLKWRKGRFYIRFERLLFKLQRDHIVTVSHYTGQMIQDIHHISDDSLSVIYNQIDTHFWNTIQVISSELITVKKTHHLTHTKIGLFVGRLGYEKWLPYLIEAMNDIITKNKDFKLVIIAPKTTHLYAQHIQQQIQLTKNHITDNQLNNHIIWIDPVPDDETLRLWMASADIGIVPSMSEWFCYTAVQMQAMWLPLIVSEVGALPEVLDHDSTTFVPYGKIKVLAQAIVQQINSLPQQWNNKRKTSSINYQAYCDLFKKLTK